MKDTGKCECGGIATELASYEDGTVEPCCTACLEAKRQFKERSSIVERFIGVKEILAKPMTRAEYNDYRGWELPADENGADKGFLVEYLDGGQANHQGHAGYVSWSPEGVFSNAYRPVTGMTFGLAIEAMKKGHKVCRKGWNGKNMWLVYMPGLSLPPYSTQGTNRKVNDRTAKWIGEDTPLESQPYIAMWTADQKWQPGWLASQTDMLAEDWMIVD